MSDDVFIGGEKYSLIHLKFRDKPMVFIYDGQGVCGFIDEDGIAIADNVIVPEHRIEVAKNLYLMECI
jgi:hypothetical protein